MGFQFALQNWPCNCCIITSIYLVGQRSRLPTPRQSRDRLAVSHGAVHASVFILPNKPQNLKLALHLFSGNIHQHHLHLTNSSLSCRSQTQPRQSPVNSTFKYSPRRKLWALCFWGHVLLQPQNCKHTHASFSPANAACVSTGYETTGSPSCVPQIPCKCFPYCLATY